MIAQEVAEEGSHLQREFLRPAREPAALVVAQIVMKLRRDGIQAHWHDEPARAGNLPVGLGTAPAHRKVAFRMVVAPEAHAITRRWDSDADAGQRLCDVSYRRHGLEERELRCRLGRLLGIQYGEYVVD